ncbi:MAG: hypothetical protein WBL95_12990, partial [Microcoleus sp.]
QDACSTNTHRQDACSTKIHSQDACSTKIKSACGVSRPPKKHNPARPKNTIPPAQKTQSPTTRQNPICKLFYQPDRTAFI